MVINVQKERTISNYFKKEGPDIIQRTWGLVGGNLILSEE